MREYLWQGAETSPLRETPARALRPTLEREGLIRRALAAMDTTPGSIAAREGIDPRDLPRLLSGAGDPEAAARLARALAHASAELDRLAQELSAAAERVQ